jgi:uncharacterized MAPEG superfamily protein
MTNELYWLTLSILLTALLWVPYILNRIFEGGFLETVLRDPEGRTGTQVGWARRLMAAHGNAVENLAVFAPLILIAQVAGISTALTQTAAILYFFSRLAHVVVFTLGMPAIVRILAFFGGFIAQMIVAVSLLGWLA